MDMKFFLLCVWFTLSGIEYGIDTFYVYLSNAFYYISHFHWFPISISAVILPTINEYLTTFNENSSGPIYLGAAFSAFSFTGLIFAPLYGRITDKCQSLKFTIIASNLFEIAGKVFLKKFNF